VSSINPCLAAREGDEAIVKIILAHGAHINAVDCLQRTALCVAASYHRYAMVELLFEAGADVEIQDFLGKTALMYMVKIRDENILHLLLRLGANLDALDIYHYSALRWAVGMGEIRTVQLLLDNGADPNVGISPLAFARESLSCLGEASKQTYEEIIQALLDAGAFEISANNCHST
jgi:ankyrin repeat protein